MRGPRRSEPETRRAEPSPRSTDTLAQGGGAREGASALEQMRDRVADAMNQLTNGNGPRPAAQTETITMGEPIGGRDRDETVRTHIVRKGETLWKIAERYYGTGFVHEDLLRYNRSRIRSTRDINPGLTLLIPPRHKLNDPPVSLSQAQASESRRDARRRPPRGRGRTPSARATRSRRSPSRSSAPRSGGRRSWSSTRADSTSRRTSSWA